MDTDRIHRALTQNLALISRHSVDRHDCCKFLVLGSTSAQYEVRMNPHLSGRVWLCSCPDFALRGTTCKHIFYVLARVLGLGRGLLALAVGCPETSLNLCKFYHSPMGSAKPASALAPAEVKPSSDIPNESDGTLRTWRRDPRGRLERVDG
jgi:hypothetical protein